MLTTDIVWEIKQLTVNDIDGLSDVVVCVNWRATLMDPATENCVMKHGIVTLPAPDPTSFTEFENLDSETVVSWIKAHGFNTDEEYNKQVTYDTENKIVDDKKIHGYPLAEFENRIVEELDKKNSATTSTKLPSSW